MIIFLGGLTIYESSECRCYRLSVADFINISYGKRNLCSSQAKNNRVNENRLADQTNIKFNLRNKNIQKDPRFVKSVEKGATVSTDVGISNDQISKKTVPNELFKNNPTKNTKKYNLTKNSFGKSLPMDHNEKEPESSKSGSKCVSSSSRIAVIETNGRKAPKKESSNYNT